MHIHAMWQMGLEYCDAIVYQAKVHQAKKVYEEENAMTVEDSVKSAMSPFLVLEVRRDHLIEDTLVHVKLKVVLLINNCMTASSHHLAEPTCHFPVLSLQAKFIQISWLACPFRFTISILPYQIHVACYGSMITSLPQVVNVFHASLFWKLFIHKLEASYFNN